MPAVAKPVRSLPTLQKLGTTVNRNLDAQAVAKEWFLVFADAMNSGDHITVASLLVEDAFWRDLLALTWDFHTYEGRDIIQQFIADQLPKFEPSTFRIRNDLTQLYVPYEDIVCIQAFFDFETTVGYASGIFRLVPLADGSWKAHTVFTNLEDLRDFPEKIGALRDHEPYHKEWVESREREHEFLDVEPGVVIVGGGQSGLTVAARLKALGINALVVERNKRIGDNWRNRYATLCTHSIVWHDHFPYMPFPSSWPVYRPAAKLGDWLETYAHSLELNVWTSAEVVSVEPGTQEKKWSVKVERDDGRERIFQVSHVVFALGIGGGLPNIPNIPCQAEFKGRILHSSQHKRATDHLGKKVVVIGACTSAHDICADYVDHGVDVTMVQRSSTYIMSVKEGMPRLTGGLYVENGPPTDIADRINASFPNFFLKLMHQRMVKDLAEADKDILDGLRRVGFKLNLGDEGSGPLQLIWKRGGGFYFDVGASQKIIDGEIKLKSNGSIARFTPHGLLFGDGSTLDAEVVIFATGFAGGRTAYLRLLPNYLHDAVQPIWGLDDEGELHSVAREVGGRGPQAAKVAGLWAMLGNMAVCRFHSKHVALQIKAYEEGIFGERY
ncbi:FAD/NAD(P)-binding domain-containing protein [Pisolithus croceorrhizus]|nr:FAD/NAD(P)-binding domain-containing protein [Pisolithus croceorrhizus]KAI6133977.1 FAD/NAD(P)-binding domain-containing protein [Pisolithus croceorrhizus]